MLLMKRRDLTNIVPPPAKPLRAFFAYKSLKRVLIKGTDDGVSILLIVFFVATS